MLFLKHCLMIYHTNAIVHGIFSRSLTLIWIIGTSHGTTHITAYPTGHASTRSSWPTLSHTNTGSWIKTGNPRYMIKLSAIWELRQISVISRILLLSYPGAIGRFLMRYVKTPSQQRSKQTAYLAERYTREWTHSLSLTRVSPYHFVSCQFCQLFDIK